MGGRPPRSRSPARSAAPREPAEERREGRRGDSEWMTQHDPTDINTRKECRGAEISDVGASVRFTAPQKKLRIKAGRLQISDCAEF